MMLSKLSFCLALFGCVNGVSAVAADQNDSCEKWALSGECTANPGYMLASCATSCYALERGNVELKKEVEAVGSFFDLTAYDIDGKAVDFSKFRGQMTILTNVASYCGRTEDHYKGLVDLWTKVATTGMPVNILAFPCNQFGKQEPGTAQEIKNFAKEQGVKFTMMQKIEVNGPNASLVYKFLKYHTGIDMIKWNFDTYFFIEGDGTVKEFSDVHPDALIEEVFRRVDPSEL